MTVHYLLQTPQRHQGRKQKAIEVVALMRRGIPLTAKQIEEHCDMTENNVRSTLALLLDYELIQFAGYAERAVGARGAVPAKWVWA